MREGETSFDQLLSDACIWQYVQYVEEEET